MPVNGLERVIENPRNGHRMRFAFITSLDIDASHVGERAACGRARWKIENEAFNTPGNFGTSLLHSFGHGQDTLSTVPVTRNRLAFAMHGMCDMAQDLWQQARTVAGTRKAMVQHNSIITRYHLFGNWTEMLLVMAGRKAVPSLPSVRLREFLRSSQVILAGNRAFFVSTLIQVVQSHAFPGKLVARNL